MRSWRRRYATFRHTHRSRGQAGRGWPTLPAPDSNDDGTLPWQVLTNSRAPQTQTAEPQDDGATTMLRPSMGGAAAAARAARGCPKHGPPAGSAHRGPTWRSHTVPHTKGGILCVVRRVHARTSMARPAPWTRHDLGRALAWASANRASSPASVNLVSSIVTITLG